MGHELQDHAGLELGKAIAARLEEDPGRVAIASENLDRWERRNADSPGLLRCYREWRELLELPVEKVCELLREDSEHARRLRQNSPFPGVLTPREVWAIKERCRDEAKRA